MINTKDRPYFLQLANIPQNQTYLHQTRIMSRDEVRSILNQYRFDNEYFFVGKNLPLNLIEYNYYTEQSHYWKHIIQTLFENYDNGKIENVSGDYRIFKWISLTKAWFRDRKFQGMVGAHWNPRLNKIIIHPGAQRFNVFNMFPSIGTLDYCFWNTNGIDLNLEERDFKKITVDELLDDYDYDIAGLTLDHGGFVPHPLSRFPYNIVNEADLERRLVKDFITNNKKFYINKEIDIPPKYYTTDSNEDVSSIIEIKNSNQAFYRQVTRALLLHFARIEFEDEFISVKINE